jgi:hypothetical protein
MPVQQNIKEQILRELESLNPNEQQTLLGIVENYIHNKADETEWNTFPPEWKKRIEESLQQANEGNLILHEDALLYLRKKYGLNG